MSKGYTISYFVKALKNAPTRAVGNTASSVFQAVSPRLGLFSVKADALDTWLNYQTHNIAQGAGIFSTYGKTPRARLIRALNNRFKNGSI